MSSATLTSLAMLKVTIDHGQDYFDYLRPFILQILVDEKLDPITDHVVQDYLQSHFGLEIPERTVQLVLRRLSKNKLLRKETGEYHIAGNLPDPNIGVEKAQAERHIQAVVSGLVEFSKSTPKPISERDNAVTAICTFLSQFEIPCIRSYLRGTAIPTIPGWHETDIVLVSEYVQKLYQTNPERFDSFMIMVQGHMLANAFLCPDLQFAPKSYKGMTFLFDTPLVIQRLGLEGEQKQRAVEDLMTLLHNLGATVAVFSHSLKELGRVLDGAANYIENPNGRSAIILEARRRDKTKSDLLLYKIQIEEKLTETEINIFPTPKYDKNFQIDEIAFEEALDDEISYWNPRAREDDINSVRSIYVLRAHKSPTTLEKSKFVLVTNNTAFARAAFEYGQQHEETREVSSVITDFSLANMAWLKAPMGAPSLPTTEILAFSYAALQPSKKMLERYLMEIEKLESRGKITEIEYQLLRSSTLAQEDLMYLTLGDEEALTEETITKTLERVTDEIRKEGNEKFRTEHDAHRRTQNELSVERDEKRRLKERIYWHCEKQAKMLAGLVSFIIVTLLLVGMVGGVVLLPGNMILASGLILGVVFLGFFTLGSLVWGITVKTLHRQIQGRCLAWLLKHQTAKTGLDFSEIR